ncbi:glycosyltransferase family 4 protein [Marinobacter sp. EN3]|uniref:glycosyltransferase family 4 protein n=1 Tax=Marinobacter sp. EN3 TaxID=1397533 RepID=UPI0004B615FF|nr:glycosyltransferase family 4 protein [Marinobacter sp. EN3]
MKVLAIHRYYWPDTPPYASMLRAIVKQWVSDGHEVDVLSSQPSYKVCVENRRQPRRESVDGAQVVRMRLPPESGRPVIRILNALRFGVGIFWRAVIRKRYDVIMVSTSPPVLGGWFAALAAKLSGARFIYHCMDIHPEIGRISGEFSNPKVFNLLSKLDSWACAQARPVVVLSQDMADSLTGRKSGTIPDTFVINNFSLPSDVDEVAELPFEWPKARFVLIFAGNIGRFQGLDALIDAMIALKSRSDIHLLMMGEGVEKDRLTEKARHAGANVTFVGHQSVQTAKAAMARAGAGFVSLLPELYRFAYPSKTMTYLEQGCPVLVAVEPSSCLARDVVESGSGLAVPAGDADALSEALIKMAESQERLSEMRQRALDLSSQAFATDVVLARWSSVLK